jgi:hypothetical protein
MSAIIIRAISSPAIMNDDTVILGNSVYLIDGFFTSASIQSLEDNITTGIPIGPGHYRIAQDRADQP